MNDVRENKLTMYEAVKTVLANNSAITGTIAALATAITSFTGFIDQIKAKEIERNSATQGNAQNKNDARELLKDEMMAVCGAIFSLGETTSDNTLKAEGNVSRSELSQMRDTALVTKAQTIKGVADANAAALVPFGVSAADITSLETRTTTFNGLIGVRVAGSSIQGAAGAQVEALFKKADKVLVNQIDKLMENFAKSETQFYDEYHLARQIIDLGVRHEEPTPPTPPTP